METEVAKCIISISDTANIVMAIASVLNLIIVVWIFMKERKEEERKNIKNKKHDWYNSLGLKDLTIAFSKEIDSLKNNSIKYFNGELNQEEYKKIYKKADDDFLKYKSEYLTIIDCVDNSLTKKLTEDFQKIQDDLYNIVINMCGDISLKSNSNLHDITIKFDNIRKQILKMSINIID